MHLAYWRKKEAPREAREELQRGEQEGSRQRGVKKGTHSVCLEGYCKDLALTSSDGHHGRIWRKDLSQFMVFFFLNLMLAMTFFFFF